MLEDIRPYVEREVEIERARVDTRERLARYDATGEYIADADVQAWLRTCARRPPANATCVCGEHVPMGSERVRDSPDPGSS